MKRMSKKKKIFLLIGIVILVFSTAIAGAVITNLPEVFVIADVDPTSLAAGTYEGFCDNGLVKARVQVTVADQAIQSAALLEHDNGLGKAAEVIVDQVVTQQSLNVDAISGATYSSSTILKALENALLKAQ